ncbi:MAG: hypothetical protein LBP53_07585 [Candidatus Peribacteria bacterium]|nr:hypothetical protein [Candidatus Peribacteria bacterium]
MLVKKIYKEKGFLFLIKTLVKIDKWGLLWVLAIFMGSLVPVLPIGAILFVLYLKRIKDKINNFQ